MTGRDRGRRTPSPASPASRASAKSRASPAGPKLPCLTIARSPANDARVILDAFVSTPVLVRVLDAVAGGARAGDGGTWDGWVGEHRAELRAMLQHFTQRLQGVIEGQSPGREATADVPAGAVVSHLVAGRAGEGNAGEVREVRMHESEAGEPRARQPEQREPQAREPETRGVGDLRPAARPRASRGAHPAPTAAAETWPGGPLLR